MNDNVFNLVPGTKGEDDSKLPVNRYYITNIDGQEYPAEGFLIFTSQHVAVMRDFGDGAIPVLVMPLSQLKVTELVEDDNEDDDEEVPF